MAQTRNQCRRNLYLAGRHISNMDHSVILSGKDFLDGIDYGGFLYIRHTFQVCTKNQVIKL